MKINKTQIKTLNPCSDGYAWYLKNGTTGLLGTLLKVNKHNPEWARWLFTNLMNNNQKIETAIFSAKLVLHIFEEKYPNDNRPRKAIGAAELVLSGESAHAADAAQAAASAAYDAADAATYAAAAYAAYAAAYAANATYAASAAYAAAAAADNAARTKIQETIIREAVRILDRKDQTDEKA